MYALFFYCFALDFWIRFVRHSIQLTVHHLSDRHITWLLAIFIHICDTKTYEFRWRSINVISALLELVAPGDMLPSWHCKSPISNPCDHSPLSSVFQWPRPGDASRPAPMTQGAQAHRSRQRETQLELRQPPAGTRVHSWKPWGEVGARWRVGPSARRSKTRLRKAKRESNS